MNYTAVSHAPPLNPNIFALVAFFWSHILLHLTSTVCAGQLVCSFRIVGGQTFLPVGEGKRRNEFAEGHVAWLAE